MREKSDTTLESVTSRHRHISAAIFPQLRETSGRQRITQNTKLMVYQAAVISNLFYACKTWVLHRKDTVKLERFHQSKLRQILRIKWQDRVVNNEVLLRARTGSIETTITRHRLRWAGHLARVHHNRLPKQVSFSELDSGNRPRGAPKLRFQDHLKHTLKAVDIDPNNWETETANRESWRRTTREKRGL
ncbi:uncharacterized protein LOC143032214 [Oratosquilla oratoria]|uniref:uncharacterized protein LOC143032214 n=1 Tax=Oratosquilla oratoria TaxID=337810 RepID=UPI003F760AF4